LAGEVLLIKDQGHFAIDSGRLYVVTAAVVDDREGFEGEVFSVTLAHAPWGVCSHYERAISLGLGGCPSAATPMIAITRFIL
jgi:hypothetical protein